MRPPREAYVILGLEVMGTDVIVGLEWRPGEDPMWLRGEIGREVMARVFPHGDSGSTEEQLGQRAEDAIKAFWPDRAYWIEVGPSSHSYLQIFQPWPRP